VSRHHDEEEFMEGLRKSRDVIGHIYPVIVKKGTYEIIDGKHRKQIDPTWPEKEVEFPDRKSEILFRMHANYRRAVSRKERASEMLLLASILEEEGVPREQMVSKLAEITPFSERYIRNLLPSKYKMTEKRPPKKMKSGYSFVCGTSSASENRKPETENESEEQVITANLVEPAYGAVPIELPKPEAPASKNVIPETGEVISSTVIEPEQPVKPEPKRPRAVKVFPCPRCRVEVETLYCSKCFSELSIREIAKILRKAMLKEA